MHDKFAALAFVLAVTVDAQQHRQSAVNATKESIIGNDTSIVIDGQKPDLYNGTEVNTTVIGNDTEVVTVDPIVDLVDINEVWEPAPRPVYQNGTDVYSYIKVPSDEDFGDFINNVNYAGFALWDDSANTDLQDWIETIDWDEVDFPEPNFEVFGGFVGFNEVQSEDGTISVCFYMQDVFKHVVCAIGVEILEGNHGYSYTFLPKYLPEVDSPFINGWNYLPTNPSVLISENFYGYSGGAENDFGNYYDTLNHEWLIWAYNNDDGVFEFGEGSYEVFIIQTKNDLAHVFSDTIDISLQGACILAASSLAIALLAASV